MNKSETTRRYIISVAAPIFNMKGYEGTSLSDVLEETGLSKGSIYGNFRNKDDLALAALEYNLDFVSMRIFASIKQESHSCAKLTVFARSFGTAYDDIMNSGGCPVLNAAVDSDDGNPQMRSRVRKFITDWKKNIVNIIEYGKKRNEISPDTDAENFALLFISTIEGGLLLSKIMGQRKFLDQASEHLVSIIKEMRAG